MFKNPLGSNGRIRRSEYGISIILYFFIATLLNLTIANGIEGVFILYIPALWFFCAQGAKRCHDLGRSGIWQFIPFYGLWMCFQAGMPGPNKYGPDPKDQRFNGIKDTTVDDMPIEDRELHEAEKEVLEMDENNLIPYDSSALHPIEESTAPVKHENQIDTNERKNQIMPKYKLSINKYTPIIVAIIIMIIYIIYETSR
jgi:uncharacterized membrane protein YhaH (DUF805 family)